MALDDPLVATEPSLMRRINAASALRAVRHLERLTVSQLMERTGLSRRTAEAVLDGLVRDGLITEEPPPTIGRAVGRPARTFRFRADAGSAMGIDIDRRSIQAMLTDLSGSLLGTVEVTVPASSSRAVRLDAVHEAAGRVLEQCGQSASSLWAVTVGTPGVVLPDGSITVCKVLPDWSDFSLRDALAPGFGCPVTVENDTNLSAVGERWRGSSGDLDDAVWVQTGRRIRIAILLGGRLHRGSDGAAGEVGWLSQLAWAAVRDHPLSSSGAGRYAVDPEFLRLVAVARSGDERALASFDSYGRALSLGLAAVVLTLNPRCLVIGGAAAMAGDVLTMAVRRHLMTKCLVVPDVRTSRLGSESVMTGAARTSLDTIERSLFSVRGVAVRAASGAGQ